ncbi:MAG: hypothetical protein CMC91_01615 [Flavobacteriaceae bacterium]|nr:hypothetical protein [Flavobacteriaceae bacterium]
MSFQRGDIRLQCLNGLLKLCYLRL